jgi:hypothetical protein
MECPPKPKRCPNKTTCHKKTKICTAKTVKCSKGTKLNPVTKACNVRPFTYKRCPTGSRRNKTSGECENDFITLCNKHIMVSNLDNVIQTSSLSNKDCTVFLIGEQHKTHTKCIEILEMMKQLIKENSALSKPVQIDLMIEILQSSTTVYKSKSYRANNHQLNNIRNHFHDCMTTHKCPVRVHWTDPTQTSHDKTKLTKTHPKDIHDWLHQLARTDFFKDDWTKNESITNYFNKESDMPTLLTENRFVVKEIKKASKINPAFTLEFATKIFMDSYSKHKKYYKASWQKLVKLQTRYVMDFYVAARIIKLKMKNVIYYAGDEHINNIITILTALDFKTIKNITGKCI